MWAMIAISVLTLDSMNIRIVILAMGLIGTIVMGFAVKTITVKS
jgi:hypothetical protein